MPVFLPAFSLNRTGFFAVRSRLANSSILLGSGLGREGMDTFRGASRVTLSNRYSMGSDTNTGPWGELMAIWQARWMVETRMFLSLTPKLHLTHRSTSRAGPPTSERKRIHWPPGSGPSSSPKAMDSPVKTTMGTCSWSAPRRAMEPWSAPTVVWIMTPGSLPVDLA